MQRRLTQASPGVGLPAMQLIDGRLEPGKTQPDQRIVKIMACPSALQLAGNLSTGHAALVIDRPHITARHEAQRRAIGRTQAPPGSQTVHEGQPVHRVPGGQGKVNRGCIPGNAPCSIRTHGGRGAHSLRPHSRSPLEQAVRYLGTRRHLVTHPSLRRDAEHGQRPLGTSGLVPRHMPQPPQQWPIRGKARMAPGRRSQALQQRGQSGKRGSRNTGARRDEDGHGKIDMSAQILTIAQPQ